MEFNWQAIPGQPWNKARQCFTPVGRLEVSPGRGAIYSRTYRVKVNGRTLDRHVRNIAEACDIAEREAIVLSGSAQIIEDRRSNRAASEGIARRSV